MLRILTWVGAFLCLYFLQSLLPVLCAQAGILFNLLFHLIGSQVLLLAKCLHLNVGFGNPLFHQELLRQRGTPFGERLIVGLRSALIGVSRENQASIGLER